MSDKLKIMQTRLSGSAHSDAADLYCASIGYPHLQLLPDSAKETCDRECEQPSIADFESFFAASE